MHHARSSVLDTALRAPSRNSGVMSQMFKKRALLLIAICCRLFDTQCPQQQLRCPGLPERSLEVESVKKNLIRR
jgi:hypothetical protein